MPRQLKPLPECFNKPFHFVFPRTFTPQGLRILEAVYLGKYNDRYLVFVYGWMSGIPYNSSRKNWHREMTTEERSLFCVSNHLMSYRCPFNTRLSLGERALNARERVLSFSHKEMLSILEAPEPTYKSGLSQFMVKHGMLGEQTDHPGFPFRFKRLSDAADVPY